MKENQYADILHLPHPRLKNHIRMSRENRAAQFAPFAALTGYDAAIKETGRTTDMRIFLEESEISDINEKLFYLQSNPSENVYLVYFLSDSQKDGGSFETYSGLLKKIDETEKCIYTAAGTVIPFCDIIRLTIQDENKPEQ